MTIEDYQRQIGNHKLEIQKHVTEIKILEQKIWYERGKKIDEKIEKPENKEKSKLLNEIP